MVRNLLIPMLLPFSGLFAQQADVAFEEGLASLREEEPSEAIRHFTHAVADEPGHAKAWYYRGVSRDAIGDHGGALQDLDRALQLDPADLHALLRHAEVNMHAGRHPEAIADADRLLGLMPEGPLARHALLVQGEALLAIDEPLSARACYDRLLDMAPDDAIAHADRGIALHTLGEFDAALEAFDRALDLDPSLTMAYGHRAVVHIHLEQVPEACADLAKARDLGDPSVDEMLLIYCY